VKIVDMNASLSGDLGPHFTDYTTAANIALINQFYEETPGLRNTSEEKSPQVRPASGEGRVRFAEEDAGGAALALRIWW
jgi:hypothetical protein